MQPPTPPGQPVAHGQPRIQGRLPPRGRMQRVACTTSAPLRPGSAHCIDTRSRVPVVGGSPLPDILGRVVLAGDRRPAGARCRRLAAGARNPGADRRPTRRPRVAGELTCGDGPHDPAGGTPPRGPATADPLPAAPLRRGPADRGPGPRPAVGSRRPLPGHPAGGSADRAAPCRGAPRRGPAGRSTPAGGARALTCSRSIASLPRALSSRIRRPPPFEPHGSSPHEGNENHRHRPARRPDNVVGVPRRRLPQRGRRGGDLQHLLRRPRSGAQHAGPAYPSPPRCPPGRIQLHFDDTDAMGWASIDNGAAGDEVWLDRSMDGGRTWSDGSKLGDTTMPVGPERLAHPDVQRRRLEQRRRRRAAGLRAGQPAVRPSRARPGRAPPGTPGAGSTAAATALMMSYDRGTKLFGGNGWWTSANALTAIIDNARISGMGSYEYAIAQTYNKNLGAQERQLHQRLPGRHRLVGPGLGGRLRPDRRQPLSEHRPRRRRPHERLLERHLRRRRAVERRRHVQERDHQRAVPLPQRRPAQPHLRRHRPTWAGRRASGRGSRTAA